MSAPSVTRPLTQQCYLALMLDVWPGTAARVDFGLDGYGEFTQDCRQRRYEALQAGIRSGEITEADLDAAIGDGPKLTELVNRCGCNPYPGIVFQTAYDRMGDE